MSRTTGNHDWQDGCCGESINRRRFLQTSSAVAAGVMGVGGVGAQLASAAPRPGAASATAVTEFYESLSESQMMSICFPYQHALRSRVNANWHITKPLIGEDFFSDAQRELIDQIIRSVTTDDGYDRLQLAMDDDNGGVDSYSVAMFGAPGAGKFQWELTGRHLTLRADGDRLDRAAFGGPIVYGHGEEDPDANIYHYQTKKTNEVFEALDPAQAKQALIPRIPRETAVRLQGKRGRFPGLAVSEMSDDQKELVAETLKVLLAPYRPDAIDEVMSILDANGGIDSLSMAFSQQGDLNDDRLWDNWRIEGPSFVWHFRGAPHVHAYINIGAASA